ncbi:hypothetical protein [Eggerthella sinensis]|jgi:hypothetical protein|uniref:hypothetical protein n=1 Tax=Eggerthella sinensis TaxID=242230 RepID=UPI0011CE6C15|nr:hypothetical protein [Eggerthella sinensis]
MQDYVGLLGAVIGSLLTILVSLLLNMVNNQALNAKISIYNGWRINAKPDEMAALVRLRKQIVKRIGTMTWKDNAEVAVTILLFAAACTLFGHSFSGLPQYPIWMVPLSALALVAIGMLAGAKLFDESNPKDAKRK